MDVALGKTSTGLDLNSRSNTECQILNTVYVCEIYSSLILIDMLCDYVTCDITNSFYSALVCK